MPKPLYPANFTNRLQANWRLLLAIAELAGGQWPKQAREAAARLSHLTTQTKLGRADAASVPENLCRRSQANHVEGSRVACSLPIPTACGANTITAVPSHSGRWQPSLSPSKSTQSSFIPPGDPTRRHAATSVEQFRDAFARFLGAPSIRTSAHNLASARESECADVRIKGQADAEREARRNLQVKCFISDEGHVWI